MNDNEPVDYEQLWKDLKSGEFASMIRESAPGQKVCNSHELYNIMKPLFAAEPDVEKLYGIFLNANNQIMAIECLGQGSLNSCQVYPRQVVKKVLSHQASALIISHNHPSGNTEPSPDDLQITFKIMLAVMSIDVTVHEHFIVGRDTWHSMEGCGTIANIKRKIEAIDFN